MSKLALDTAMEQDWLSVNRRRELSPEQEMMLACLWDAVSLIQQEPTNDDARQLKREAERWVLSNDASWPFSFVNLCQALNLDAQCLRRALAKIPKSPSLTPQASGDRAPNQPGWTRP
jgi:hypothetical protein